MDKHGRHRNDEVSERHSKRKMDNKLKERWRSGQTKKQEDKADQKTDERTQQKQQMLVCCSAFYCLYRSDIVCKASRRHSIFCSLLVWII